MNSALNLLYKPYAILWLPFRNCLLELIHLIFDNFRYIVQYLIFSFFAYGLVSSFGYHKLAVRCLRWILLGVASSIGFGFGMHTFVLFLAPHIAAVTIAAHSCRTLDFPEPPYPDEIICPNYTTSEQITYSNILQKVALDSFMWGLGTAIGELPPYLAARLRAQANGRGVGGDSLNIEKGAATWEVWMIKIINNVGFIGILLCAAIPNPLFDAAGVASGIAQVPFLKFFGATLIGKAVIKVLLQSSFVVLSFHNNNLDSIVQQLDKKLADILPFTKDLNINESLTAFLEEQRRNVLSKTLDGPKETSFIKVAFNWVIFACFGLFFISLVNALDKQYRERKAFKCNRKSD